MKTDQSKSISLSGPNLAIWFALGVILMALKATHLLECSWWVAMSPFYIPIALFYAFAIWICYLLKSTNRLGRVKLGFKKLDPEATLPRYAHEGDAGMDVFALEDVELLYGRPTLVHTGIAAEIPDGYEIQVRARSGLALKGVTVWNSPGTVDSKYRGEIGVVLMFTKHFDKVLHESPGAVTSKDVIVRSFKISKGDRIAQLVLSPVTFAVPEEIQDLTATVRGAAGFGSTGA